MSFQILVRFRLGRAAGGARPPSLLRLCKLRIPSLLRLAYPIELLDD